MVDRADDDKTPFCRSEGIVGSEIARNTDAERLIGEIAVLIGDADIYRLWRSCPDRRIPTDLTRWADRHARRSRDERKTELLARSRIRGHLVVHRPPGNGMRNRRRSDLRNEGADGDRLRRRRRAGNRPAWLAWRGGVC